MIGAALIGVALGGAPQIEGADDTAPAPFVPHTILGGYGQVNAEWLKMGPDARYDGTATLRRFVVYLAHDFRDDLTMQAELEWEHAIACDGCRGTVEVEQATLDWTPNRGIGVRAGLLLIPMGIVNQWHEPPVFHGVERPAVDRAILPTTWRELGFGVVGEPQEWLRYEAYLTTALDPLELGPSGLAPAKTLGSHAPANTAALSARVELEPAVGFVTGVSLYASDLGPNAAFYDGIGKQLDLFLPLYGGAIDARWRVGGLEVRGVAVGFLFPEADDLMEGKAADGSPYFPDGTGVVPSRLYGAYGEAAYDVLRLVTDSEQQLLPFVRVERYDTQASVPEGFEPDPFYAVTETTAGLTWRPVPPVVVKADVQWRDRKLGLDESQLDVGFGFMY